MSLRSFITALISLQLIFTPLTGWTEPTAEWPLSAEIIGDSVFNLIVSELAIVTNADEFDRVFARHLKSSDREYVMKSIRRLTTLPSAYRLDEELVFDFGYRKIRVSWKNASMEILDIDGVRWTLDWETSLAVQAKKLAKKLAGEKSAGSLIERLLPKADAEPFTLLGTGILGVTMSVIGKESISKLWCKSGVQTRRCIDENEAVKIGNGSTLDLLSRLAKRENSPYEAQDLDCAESEGGNGRSYRGKLRKKSKPDLWMYVLAKWDSSGVPQDVVITKDDVGSTANDPAAFDKSDKLYAHMKFDPKTKKPMKALVDESKEMEEFIGVQSTLCLLVHKYFSKSDVADSPKSSH